MLQHMHAIILVNKSYIILRYLTRRTSSRLGKAKLEEMKEGLQGKSTIHREKEQLYDLLSPIRCRKLIKDTATDRK